MTARIKTLYVHVFIIFDVPYSTTKPKQQIIDRNRMYLLVDALRIHSGVVD